MQTTSNRITRPIGLSPLFDAKTLASIDAARRAERADHEKLKTRVLAALKRLRRLLAELSTLAEVLNDDGETLTVIVECRVR